MIELIKFLDSLHLDNKNKVLVAIDLLLLFVFFMVSYLVLLHDGLNIKGIMECDTKSNAIRLVQFISWLVVCVGVIYLIRYFFLVKLPQFVGRHPHLFVKYFLSPNAKTALIMYSSNQTAMHEQLLSELKIYKTNVVPSEDTKQLKLLSGIILKLILLFSVVIPFCTKISFLIILAGLLISVAVFVLIEVALIMIVGGKKMQQLLEYYSK